MTGAPSRCRNEPLAVSARQQRVGVEPARTTSSRRGVSVPRGRDALAPGRRLLARASQGAEERFRGRSDAVVAEQEAEPLPVLIDRPTEVALL
jgi:hypothetical protein